MHGLLTPRGVQQWEEAEVGDGPRQSTDGTASRTTGILPSAVKHAARRGPLPHRIANGARRERIEAPTLRAGRVVAPRGSAAAKSGSSHDTHAGAGYGMRQEAADERRRHPRCGTGGARRPPCCGASLPHKWAPGGWSPAGRGREDGGEGVLGAKEPHAGQASAAGPAEGGNRRRASAAAAATAAPAAPHQAAPHRCVPSAPQRVPSPCCPSGQAGCAVRRLVGAAPLQTSPRGSATRCVGRGRARPSSHAMLRRAVRHRRLARARRLRPRWAVCWSWRPGLSVREHRALPRGWLRCDREGCACERGRSCGRAPYVTIRAGFPATAPLRRAPPATDAKSRTADSRSHVIAPKLFIDHIIATCLSQLLMASERMTRYGPRFRMAGTEWERGAPASTGSNTPVTPLSDPFGRGVQGLPLADAMCRLLPRTSCPPPRDSLAPSAVLSDRGCHALPSHQEEKPHKRLRHGEHVGTVLTFFGRANACADRVWRDSRGPT